MTESPSVLEVTSDVANIVIAFATLLLAAYIFLYQRKQDSKSNKIQWFRDLIVEPNKEILFNFYGELTNKLSFFTRNGLSVGEKIHQMDEIKTHFSDFRKDFLLLLLAFDNALFEDLKKHLDKLLDDLTANIYNNSLLLTDEIVYEAYIQDLVFSSKNYVISRLAKYKG